MVIDGVSDLITLTPEQIKSAPKMGAVLDTDYLIGVGTLDERKLILLDVVRLMLIADMWLIEKLARKKHISNESSDASHCLGFVKG